MSNIIDSIQLSGVTYTLQGSGGGGKAISAGTNISVTTGETADTVSCTLPLTVGSSNSSLSLGVDNSLNNSSRTFAIGDRNSIGNSSSNSLVGGMRSSINYNCASSIAFGYEANVGGRYSCSIGSNTKTSNQFEAAFGRYNASNTGSTDADKTRFSVGNGTDDNARHNAFEIRQNGDIYLSLNGQDVKLQDQLGGGGNPTVELTQAEYDALVTAGTVSADTYYIITDATPVDVSQYWTSAQTQSAITQATSGKVNTSSIVSSVTSASTDSEIPTAKAVWEAASGGGTTYTAGRGIDITNDTISVSLPISAGTGTNSVAEGNGTTANGNSSHAEGKSTIASGSYSHAEGWHANASGNYSHAEGTTAIAIGESSHAEGYFTITNNKAEHASGRYNVSNKANNTFGDSGNTLFSVGNGTADNARHNAFEIRQNGDIYLSSGGTDIKLQDHLGGGSITVDTALDSGSTNPVENRVIYNKIDEIEQVTAAALNNINDRLSEDEEVTAAGLNALNDNFGGLKLVKLTQAEYNALATKDSSTLYVIVD